MLGPGGVEVKATDAEGNRTLPAELCCGDVVQLFEPEDKVSGQSETRIAFVFFSGRSGFGSCVWRVFR